jgi:mono/diheme cytochrome c family protein
MSKPKRRPVTTRPPRRQPKWPLLLGGAAVVSALIAIAVMAEPDAASLVVPRDQETIAAGATIFSANCAVCHGADLLGSTTGPPLLHPYYAPNHHADEAFQRAVAFGVVPHHWNFGEMAPLSHLTRSDVDKIIAFVRTEQEKAGIFEDPGH